MRKLLLLILCAALILSSCGDDTTTINSVTISDKQDDITYLKEGERITITSLDEWYKFNYDGNFTDNCKNFLRMFIEGTSNFAEFETVKLSDWEIIRDPEVYGYDLAFNFTVTESALESLPAGTYRTIVKDSVDCYITFDTTDPTRINDGLNVLSTYADAICDWINSTYSWSVPEYGKAVDEMQLTCLNYFIDRYGKNEKILNFEFKELLSEKLGVMANEELFNELYTVENNNLYIKRNVLNGITDFTVIEEKTNDGITTVTVQFFADCNRFIKSDVVEYYIDEQERILGCERIVFSDYEPYGVTNKFNEKS